MSNRRVEWGVCVWGGSLCAHFLFNAGHGWHSLTQYETSGGKAFPTGYDILSSKSKRYKAQDVCLICQHSGCKC